MAVGTHDFALFDLGTQRSQTGPCVRQQADRANLVPKMVEVQDDEVLFPADDAWVFAEVIEDVLSRACSPGALGCR